jgi:hypothetical protein
MQAIIEKPASKIVKISESGCAAAIFFVSEMKDKCIARIRRVVMLVNRAAAADSESQLLAIKIFLRWSWESPFGAHENALLANRKNPIRKIGPAIAPRYRAVMRLPAHAFATAASTNQ